MITTNSHIKVIRQEVKDLLAKFKEQSATAKGIGALINPIGSIALNKTKVAIVAWYEAALSIYEDNQVLIETRTSAKQHEDDGVIANNCDFGKFFLTGETIHRKWMVAKDGSQGSLTFIREGQFYKTYAGDAFRFAEALGYSASIQICDKYNVLMTGFPHHVATKFNRALAEKGYKATLVE